MAKRRWAPPDPALVSPARRRLVRWMRHQAHLSLTARTCWICETEIDMSLPPNHRMSFTVHEKQARNHRGSATDPANCVPAHRACNSSLGDGDVIEWRLRHPAPRGTPSRTW